LNGIDKLYLQYNGERLLSRIARQLSTRFTDLIAVSSRPVAFDGMGFRVVPDVVTGAGPLGGLYSGLLAARSEWVYLLACDMPFFSASWVDALRSGIDMGDRAPISAVAACDGPYHQPLHAMYHRSLAGIIQDRLATCGTVPSLQSVACGPGLLLLNPESWLDEEPELFRSVNTPQDLADLGEAVTSSRNRSGL